MWDPIACTKAFAVGEYSNISDILKQSCSHILCVINAPPCNICLVAVFELAAASFCTPTKAFGSGVAASLASFNPVVSLIICR